MCTSYQQMAEAKAEARTGIPRPAEAAGFAHTFYHFKLGSVTKTTRDKHGSLSHYYF